MRPLIAFVAPGLLQRIILICLLPISGTLQKERSLSWALLFETDSPVCTVETVMKGEKYNFRLDFLVFLPFGTIWEKEKSHFQLCESKPHDKASISVATVTWYVMCVRELLISHLNSHSENAVGYDEMEYRYWKSENIQPAADKVFA